MKNRQLNFFIGLATLLAAVQATAQFKACPTPNSTVATAFNIIEQAKGRSLAAYLNENVISKTAQNEKCESMYLAAIRAKNETARRELDNIGYGPNTADEINAGVDVLFAGHITAEKINAYEFALRYGSATAVSDLRKRGGQLLNSRRLSGITELHIAVLTNTREVIAELIKSGADIQSKTDSGATALHYAAVKNTKSVVELLLKSGADVNAKNEDNWTALHVAAQANNREVVESLIRAGADINAKLSDGRTPILVAVVSNKIEVIQLLDAAGANIDITDRQKKHLLIALGTNSKEVIEYILQKGFDVNSRTHDNNTALIIAAVYGGPESLGTLLQFGAQVNLVNDEKETALIAAVKYAHQMTFARSGVTQHRIKTLLKAGADKSLKTKDGKTAYDIAVEQNLKQEIQDLLKP